HRSRRKVLVDRRQEAHLGGLELRLRLPQRQVEAGKGRAAVAGHEAGRVEAALAVQRALHERKAHQGTQAGEVDGARGGGQGIVEAIVRAQDGRSVRHVAPPGVSGDPIPLAAETVYYLCLGSLPARNIVPCWQPWRKLPSHSTGSPGGSWRKSRAT